MTDFANSLSCRRRLQCRRCRTDPAWRAIVGAPETCVDPDGKRPVAVDRIPNTGHRKSKESDLAVDGIRSPVPGPTVPDPCLTCMNTDCRIRRMCCGGRERELAAGFRCPLTKPFCYWTVADGDHGRMAAVAVASARAAGVTADFHVWTDLPHIEGATVHPCGTFFDRTYMFKMHFLKNQVSRLHYDHYAFFDADNYFLRDPGDLSRLMDANNRVFIPLECVCDPKTSRHTNWWSCPIDQYAGFLREQGVVSETFYNTNAGFWIVSKTAVDEFYELTTRVFTAAHARGYRACTEEIPLAVVAHTMQEIARHTMDKTQWLWASDWGVGAWRDRIPEDREWEFVDFMTDARRNVKPCIVHCMRSKGAMLRAYWARSSR